MGARFATAAAALVVFAFVPLRAGAQPKKSDAAKKRTKSEIRERVDTHLRRGIEFYAEKQYELAIVEFRAGFRLDPRPDFLFALAQAERLSGDCPTAVIYYRRFLKTKPAANQREAARINMKRCNRALESGPGGRPDKQTDDALRDAEGVKQVPAAMPTNTDEQVAAKPWYRDRVATSLLVAGVIGAGIGSGFWVASASAKSAADDAANLDDFRANMNAASSRRTISLVSLAAAGGLIAAGVVRLLLRKPGSKSKPRSAAAHAFAAAPTTNAVVVGLVGRF